MKPDELMIGDWVRLAPGVPMGDRIYLNKAVKVMGLADDDGGIKVYIDIEESPWADYWSEDENDFEPIPLTDEILEKNGWKPFANIDGFYIEDDYDYTKMVVWSDGIWVFRNVCKEMQTPNTQCVIGYVHELQHALRLCGLTELADNLQLEGGEK